MNPKLIGFLALFLGHFLAPKAFAQNSENFDGVPIAGLGWSQGPLGIPREINDWSFALLTPAGLNDVNAYTDITNMPGQSSMLSGLNDKVAFLSGTIGLANAAAIKTLSATAFHLISFRIESGDAVAQLYRVTGYKGGIAVPGASFNFTAPAYPSGGGLLVAPVEDAWNSVDEFRVTRQDGISDIYFYLDDIVVGQALPVAFGEIEATVAGGQLRVDWSTITETNNASFVVEGSLDGQTFKSLAVVKSKAEGGNSVLPLYYTVGLSAGTQLLLSLGFLLLGVASLKRKRSRMHKLFAGLLIGLGLVGMNACSKGDAEGIGVFSEDFYVRITQVDKDGTRSHSKTVKAVIK